MRLDLTVTLESIGALVRARIVTWYGYRGGGRRPQFLANCVKLALYLAEQNYRRSEGLVVIDRRALSRQKRLNMSENSVRGSLKCLREIGFVCHASPLMRKPGSPHRAPRRYSFGEAVRALFAVLHPDKTLNGSEERTKGREETTLVNIWVGSAASTAAKAVKDAAKAVLRSLFPGDDLAFEAHWRSLPGR